MRCLALLLLSSCALESTSNVEQEIIGGDPAPNDGSVVLLVAYPADKSTMYTCTASVIAPKVVLTAAHCVDHTNFRYGVFYGADGSGTLASLIPQMADVTSVQMYPAYSRNAPFTGDVAIVLLTNPAPVAALPILRVAPSAGVQARIVGYGQRVYGTYNATRRQAMTTLAAIDAGDTITVGDATRHTCIGDSGGPALIMANGIETVAGVNSYGPSGCTDPAHFRRTDLYTAFIDPYLRTPDPDPMPDPMPDPDPMPQDNDDEGGGCSTTTPAGLAFALLMVFGIVRRTRRYPRA
jgi:secreted trypsin-like serine protease